METQQREIYIASGIFVVVGILFLIVGFDAGGWSSQKIVISLGVILDVLGIAGLIKPSIGEVILHYVRGLAKAQEKTSYSQHQHRPKNSPQIQAGRDVIYNGATPEKRKKIRDFILLKHAYDNRKRLFTSKELATITNKDLEEVNESLRYFKEKGWVTLGNTSEQASFAIIFTASGIDVVEENLE